VEAGGPGEPDLYQPLEQVLTDVEASTNALAAEIGLAVLTSALRLPPGGDGEVALEVTNRLASPVRAEAQLVSPFGSWEALGPWTQGVQAAPGERVTARFGVRIPATARPGRQWWALVKVMYFGRVRYSAAVPVTVISAEEGS
jgi:alpha-mannosidase